MSLVKLTCHENNNMKDIYIYTYNIIINVMVKYFMLMIKIALTEHPNSECVGEICMSMISISITRHPNTDPWYEIIKHYHLTLSEAGLDKEHHVYVKFPNRGEAILIPVGCTDTHGNDLSIDEITSNLFSDRGIPNPDQYRMEITARDGHVIQAGGKERCTDYIQYFASDICITYVRK
ncbi:unnamed protein product [Lymnaea stagnalis]|uniref:Uncharacterized protein n=1 Tax=Lymnaea stagnalis TaxID=6523 RepID=A0AAV2HA17_LYMST